MNVPWVNDGNQSLVGVTDGKQCLERMAVGEAEDWVYWFGRVNDGN